MPIFEPGASATAKVKVMASPAGLASQAVLALATTSPVVSRTVSFTSTGTQQEISIPITMPAATGQYGVWLDILVAGMVIRQYVGTEAVTIQVMLPSPSMTYLFTWTSPGGDYYENTLSLGTLLSYRDEAYLAYVHAAWMGENPDLTPTARGLQYADSAKGQIENEITELLNANGFSSSTVSFTDPVTACGAFENRYSCYIRVPGNVNVNGTLVLGVQEKGTITQYIEEWYSPSPDENDIITGARVTWRNDSTVAFAGRVLVMYNRINFNATQNQDATLQPGQSITVSFTFEVQGVSIWSVKLLALPSLRLLDRR